MYIEKPYEKVRDMTEKKNTIRKICNQVYAKDTYTAAATITSLISLVILINGKPSLAVAVSCMAAGQFFAAKEFSQETKIYKMGNDGFSVSNPTGKAEEYTVTKLQKEHLIASTEKTVKLMEKMHSATSDSKRKKIQKKLDREKRFRSDVLSTGNILRENKHYSTLKA